MRQVRHDPGLVAVQRVFGGYGAELSLAMAWRGDGHGDADGGGVGAGLGPRMIGDRHRQMQGAGALQPLGDGPTAERLGDGIGGDETKAFERPSRVSNSAARSHQ